MALGNLPIAANGLPLVPLGNDIRAPHHYWKKFLLWLFAVTSNEAKTLPQKVGLPNLEVYYVNVRSYKDCYPNIYWKHFFLSSFNEKSCLYFTSKCKQMYGLLPHRYWQGFFALVICSATSNEAKMLQLKMGLLILEVAFSQPDKVLFGKKLLPPGAKLVKWIDLEIK